ncbi:MAG: hypothetical protein NWE89_16705 [Candidatus Bathyarchaeota archaeon]|nr:hypothetical protein [Candidatus Bathyarchaeota archaeon]
MVRWGPNDEKDRRILKVSPWKSLQNLGTIEPRSGVYVFTDSLYNVKYIGKAGHGKMLQEINQAMEIGKDTGAEHVKALFTTSETNAESLQRRLVSKYKPSNNN